MKTEDPREHELQGAIDASLRRLFTPPDLSHLDVPGASSVERSGPEIHGWQPWTLLGAAAAAVLLVLALRGTWMGIDPEAPAGSEVAESTPNGLERVPYDPEHPRIPAVPAEEILEPDLEELYAEVTALPSTFNACASVEELQESRSDLRAMLLARYGADLSIRPEAETVLQGPFPSREWPTGTILTGQTGDDPSVVIAEHSRQHQCCLHVHLPANSRLRVFHWQLGALHLTEITPLEEPRLLQLFEAP
jgi:hypothetical protein